MLLREKAASEKKNAKKQLERVIAEGIHEVDAISSNDDDGVISGYYLIMELEIWCVCA